MSSDRPFPDRRRPLSPRRAACALAGALLLAAALPAAAADRVALIIGNGAYSAMPALAHPAADATDLAEAFAGIGFEVTALTDADGRRLRAAFRTFESKAIQASVAVVYYSGRAIGKDGVNYLLPVDARLARESHADDEGVPLSRFVAAVGGARDVRLVMIDAEAGGAPATIGRSLGKHRLSAGLEPVGPGPSAVIALAGRPAGETGDGAARNGAYAAALLAHLGSPGLDLATLLARVHGEVTATTGGRHAPVVVGSIDSAVPIALDPETLAALGRSAPVMQSGATEAEIIEAFRRAEKASTVEAWDAFLQFCPAEGSVGTFCGAATASRERLVESGVGLANRPEISGDGSGGGAVAPNWAAIIPGEDAATTCNRLAAHAYDGDKPAGVTGTDLTLLAAVAERAIAACDEAVSKHPGERRYAFQLGRAYQAAGRFNQAFEWYGRAADAGSGAALSNIGLLHASGDGVPVDHVEANRWYREAADVGNVAAMANLGWQYQNGMGVPKDLGEARRWYGNAVAAGNVTAMNLLGLLHQDALGGPRDLDTARALFERAAEEGDHYAINNLARLYNYGRGVPVDYVKARQLYEEAAALGSSSAMVSLGLLFESEQGVRRDFRVARDWYEKAAALGDATAMTNLGILYQYGRGVREDFGEAQRWYERAAALGDAASMANLGYLYDGGRGVPLDKVKAREWYLQGAEAGNAPAMASIGYLFANGQGGPVDYEAAMYWYNRGADLGNAGAMTNIGFMYEVGWGVEPSYEKAFEWYERGAQAGNAIAMANIGLMYEQGRGVETDLDNAFEWYHRAAEAGNAQAMASLAYFYSNAMGTTQDYTAALDWYTKAANLGNTIAMHNLGVAYKDGLGTEPNLRRAADLFIQAMQAQNTWTFDQFRDYPGNYPTEILVEIERYLVARGFLEGEADGEIDEATRAALTAFQQAVGGG